MLALLYTYKHEGLCKLWYCQVKSELHIKIVRVKKEQHVTKKPRKKKINEESCTLFKKLIGTQNKKAHKILAENLEVWSRFLSKLLYIRVLLNDGKSNNLLSTGHFYFPVTMCSQKVIAMNSVNNVHNIQKHLVNHDLN